MNKVICSLQNNIHRTFAYLYFNSKLYHENVLYQVFALSYIHSKSVHEKVCLLCELAAFLWSCERNGVEKTKGVP